MNQIGAGPSFGGGEGDSDSGPEKEPPAEEQQAQGSQVYGPNNVDHYDSYDLFGYNQGFYGAWGMSKDEPKEEEWTVVDKNKGKCNAKCCTKGKILDPWNKKNTRRSKSML